MFSEKIRANRRYLNKIILVMAALLLTMALLPAHVHAESAVKTKKVTMRVGQQIQLQLKGVEEPLKWKSLNKKYARVSGEGLVTARKKGTATIRVRYEGVTYKFVIKIKKRKAIQACPETIKTVVMKLKKTASAAVTLDQEETEETASGAASADLRTTARGSFAVKDVVFIGDSRFVGMQGAVGGTGTWYAKVGQGLDWMKGLSLSKKAKKGEFKGKAVVINLGVNDLYNVNNYITYLNSLAVTLVKYGATPYYMTVNPIENKKAKKCSYLVRNKDVLAFNKTIVAGLRGYGIVDTYDMLIDKSFSTVDGVHYTSATYKDIYSYLLKCICA